MFPSSWRDIYEPDTPGPPPLHRLTPRDVGVGGLGLALTGAAVSGVLTARPGCRLQVGPGSLCVQGLHPLLQLLLCGTLFCPKTPCLPAGSSPQVEGGRPHSSQDSGLSPSSQLRPGVHTAQTGLPGPHPCRRRGRFLRAGRHSVLNRHPTVTSCTHLPGSTLVATSVKRG